MFLPSGKAVWDKTVACYAKIVTRALRRHPCDYDNEATLRKIYREEASSMMSARWAFPMRSRMLKPRRLLEDE